MIHPWHDVTPGDQIPKEFATIIEIPAHSSVKYELDKDTGILKIDRPQQFSNVCPSLYGFIPRTLCADEVGRFCAERTGRSGIVGDGDPMDVCVLTERPITHGDILVRVRPIGGLRMIDGDEADDKVLAVLEDDAVFGGMQEVSECPPGMVDRLRHYFLTYKQAPDGGRRVEITHVYGRDDAHEAIRRSFLDYRKRFAAQ